MRKINSIIVHCTGTKPDKNLGVNQIRAFHRDVYKWKDIGYHFLVRLDGIIEEGRPLGEIGAHCKGFNKYSIGVCYVGGLNPFTRLPEDTRTDAQKAALEKLIDNLCSSYHCRVFGHRDFAHKDCPCFDAKEEYRRVYETYLDT